MNRPEQREGESDLAFMYRIACWISDPQRIALSYPALIDKTWIAQRPITIRRPVPYKGKVSAR